MPKKPIDWSRFDTDAHHEAQAQCRHLIHCAVDATTRRAVSVNIEHARSTGAVDLLPIMLQQLQGPCCLPPAPAAYTVTISTPIRDNGDAPFVYVVTARNRDDAAATALTVCAREQELLDPDGQVTTTAHGEPACMVEQVTTGIPAPDCGYAWNDRRNTATTS